MWVAQLPSIRLAVVLMGDSYMRRMRPGRIRISATELRRHGRCLSCSEAPSRRAIYLLQFASPSPRTQAHIIANYSW